MESNSYCEQMKPFLQEKNIKIILFMKQKKNTFAFRLYAQVRWSITLWANNP